MQPVPTDRRARRLGRPGGPYRGPRWTPCARFTVTRHSQAVALVIWLPDGGSKPELLTLPEIVARNISRFGFDSLSSIAIPPQSIVCLIGWNLCAVCRSHPKSSQTFRHIGLRVCATGRTLLHGRPSRHQFAIGGGDPCSPHRRMGSSDRRCHHRDS